MQEKRVDGVLYKLTVADTLILQRQGVGWAGVAEVNRLRCRLAGTTHSQG